MSSNNARSLNFVKAIGFTLPWETGRDRRGNLREDGGLHYRDKGLPTKYGIWQGANPDIDVVNLTVERAVDYYQERYWNCYRVMKPDALDLDALEIGLAVSVFDAGVNCGVNRAYQWWKANKSAVDPAQATNETRGIYYATLKANPTLAVNYKGWIARLNDLKKFVDVLRQEQL